MHAARCARALRAIAPEVPLVIALGRTSSGARLPMGAALDRCRHLIDVAYEARTPIGPILLDTGIEGLLNSRFDVDTLRLASDSPSVSLRMRGAPLRLAEFRVLALVDAAAPARSLAAWLRARVAFARG
jgi:hypothetical protein